MSPLLLFLAFAVALVAIAAGLHTIGLWLELFADRLHTAMWGTDTHGNPRPRCEACLYPDHGHPVDIQHVPGCAWHVPDNPAELTEESDR